MQNTVKRQEHVAMLVDSGYAEDGHRPLMRRQRPQNYKPNAIRLPILLFFAAILATCAGLIEYVLQKVVIPNNAHVSTPTATIATVARRAEPLVARYSSGTCTLLPSLTPALTSLEHSMSSLCAEFNRSYITKETSLKSTRLNAMQVTSFQQWLGSFTPIYSRISTVSFAIDMASEECEYAIQTYSTYAPWQSISDRSTHHIYMGCLTMTHELGCFGTGSIWLNSSTVQTSWMAWCAASTQDVLTLTSKHSSTTPKTTPAQNLPTLTAQRIPSTTSVFIAPSTTSATKTVIVINTTPSQTPSTTPSRTPSTTLSQTPSVKPPSSSQTPSLMSSSSVNRALLPVSSSPTSRTPSVSIASSTTSPTSVSQSLSVNKSPSSSASVSRSPFSQQTSLSIKSTSLVQSLSTLLKDLVSTTSSSISSSESQRLYTVTTQYTSVIETTGDNGRATNISAVIISETVLTTSPDAPTASLPVSTSSETPTPTVTPRPFANLTSSEKVINRDVDTFSYVAAIYLPAILAIIIKIIWEIIYSAFKLMEPFNKLTKPSGGSAKQTLFAQYLSNSMSLEAIKACFSGATLPLLTTLVYVFITLLAILATSSMTIRATAECEIAPGLNMRCNPIWVVNSVILRTVEILLLACVLLVLIIVIFTRRYRTGVAANPSSIAAVASLINQDALTLDFRIVDPLADEAELVAALSYRRCRLEYHEHDKGLQRYGICRTMTSGFYSSSQASQSSTTSIRKWFGGYSAVSNPAASKTPNSNFSKNVEAMFFDVLQLLSSAGLFAIVTAYRFDFQTDPFNNFFSSGTLQARLVIVVIAAVVDIQWKRLEREIRITEPYRRMAKGHARPETTVLLNLSGTCWSWLLGSLDKAVKYKDLWFQTLVSLVAVLSDFNIIAVASVVWSDAQTIPSRDISAYLSMSITGLMMVTMFVTMIWWRQGVVGKMPRSPETIGAVFSYLCASRFAYAMGTAQSVEELSEEEREDMLIATGWRFSFRWKAGIDGQERWIVDFETPPHMEKMPVESSPYHA